MNKIHIINWLLTRRCNLRCDYCRIVKNYYKMPKEYPDIKYYTKNEMSTKTIIEGLEKIHNHNPDAFHIFYGGEPLLRNDLAEIINYCNQNKIYYTIISNNTNEIQPLMDMLLKNVSYIQGFTASVDPIIFQDVNNDMYKKSFLGLQNLIQYSDIIKDVVAEITVSNDNSKYLYNLVYELTNKGINSDITFVDISKSPFYDFSNIEDPSILVNQNLEIKEILNKIVHDNLNIHMKNSLLFLIFNNLPSNYDCHIENDFNNLCIDADGTIRLCLRIRGVETPTNCNISNIFTKEGEITQQLIDSTWNDKKKFCLKCNHTCYMMSELISKEIDEENSLIHSNIRLGN